MVVKPPEWMNLGEGVGGEKLRAEEGTHTCHNEGQAEVTEKAQSER